MTRQVLILGGVWHLWRVVGLVPETLRDAVYRQVARNRYRWFGKYDHCVPLIDDQRARLL